MRTKDSAHITTRPTSASRGPSTSGASLACRRPLKLDVRPFTMPLSFLRFVLSISAITLTLVGTGHAGDPSIERYYKSPLLAAVMQGELERVNDLLKNGADPNQPVGMTTSDSEMPPLIWAVTGFKADISILKALIDGGANVNYRHSSSPLQNNEKTLAGRAYILMMNASRRENQTPLHFAAHLGTVEAVEYLIQRGAIVDAKNSLGETPLFGVPYTKQSSAEALIKAGANINARDNSGITTLYVRKRLPAARSDHEEVRSAYIRWLVSVGANE